jgi:hypothetical protein
MIYIPKQYGVVEHKNWTLVIESVNFMRTKIGLLIFLVEAMSLTYFVQNETLTTTLLHFMKLGMIFSFGCKQLKNLWMSIICPYIPIKLCIN